MSRTLGRIRRATGDDILVRSGRAMTPTPRALELRGETQGVVRRAAAVLTPPRTRHPGAPRAASPDPPPPPPPLPAPPAPAGAGRRRSRRPDQAAGRAVGRRRRP